MRQIGMRACRLGAVGLVSTLLWGCGGVSTPSDSREGPAGDGDADGPFTGEPVLDGYDFSYDSLDLSAVGTQSASWCELPQFAPKGFLPLTKQKLAELLAEYTVGWMTPLHESIGALHEQSLFNTTFEMVWASFDTGCNWNTEEDLTFDDDGLVDEQNRADAYQEVFNFIQGGVEIASGDALRMAVHDCADCAEPLGEAPFYVNARLSTDGVLSLEVEPFEGAPSQTYFITPEVVVAQVSLEPLSEWFQQVNSDARAGDELWPDARGTLTLVALRTPSGTWASVGVAGFSLDSQLESPDNVHFQTAASCIGMHASTDFPAAGAQSSAYLADLQAKVPGSLNCQSADCGSTETTGDWVYALNDFSIAAEQPEISSDKELEIWMSADSSAAAQLGEETFAQWQVGSEQAHGGGPFSASVDEQSEGFLVTFAPALNMRGAMVISKFSDQFQLSLPNWLEDEIFDINFGGDASSSVFVPYRAQCNDDVVNPDGADPLRPERREVEIVTGTLEAQVGSGTKTATAGECVGSTLLAESELSLTSDWADVGFVCQ